MNRSTDTLTGSPSFTIQTVKGEDGTYTATCVSLPDLQVAKAATEVEAIQAVKRLAEDFITRGNR